MMVTEDEALSKRCQESFGDGWKTTDGRMATLQETGRAVAVVASPSFCIGSACMAWRWQLHPLARQVDYDLKREIFGYCGKAGSAR